MNLTDTSEPARVTKYGTDSVEVTAGNRLTIETSPGGTEVLDISVPEGKVWTARLTVEIIEVDA